MKYTAPLYILFFIGCILVAMYRHFPGQAAADQVEQFLSATAPELGVTLAPLTLGFPLTLKSSSIETTWENEPFVRVDQFNAGFRLKTLFSDQRQIAYSGRIFGGKLTGIATLPGKDTAPPETGTDRLVTISQFDDLKLDEMVPGTFFSTLKITGRIAGTLTAGVSQSNLTNSHGEITSSNLTLEWARPLFSISALAFSDAGLSFDMPTPETVQINTCELKGSQVDIRLSGTIRPAAPAAQSGLRLTAEVIFHPEFLADTDLPQKRLSGARANTIYFTITGTIQNPIIKPGQRAG